MSNYSLDNIAKVTLTNNSGGLQKVLQIMNVNKF